MYAMPSNSATSRIAGSGNQPSLLLRAPQQRNDRRWLAAFRIFRHLLLRPLQILFGEGEISRLNFGRSKADERSSVDLAEHDVERAENGRDVGQHVAPAETIHRLQMRETRRADFALYGLLVPSATR